MKPSFRHYSELNEENIDFDFHIHTEITDGTESPERMIDAAVKEGLNRIAFTEHVTRETTWYKSFSERVFNLREEYSDIIIYLGAEAKAIDFLGNIDIPTEIVGLAELLVGVVHGYPDGNNGFLSLDQIKALGFKQTCETEFRLILAMIQNKRNGVDVIGHPFGVCSKLYEAFPINLYELLLLEALKHDKAIEINTKYLLDNDAFRLLRKIDPWISLGSDAHNTEDIAQSYKTIKGLIRK